jgi:hypothetical protein
MRISRDGWVLIGIIIVAVVFLTIMGLGPEDESKVPTTYNAGRDGAKAFYTLLGDRLGNNVERLIDPYTSLPENAAVVVVVAPLQDTPIETVESDALEAWVRAGGTAIFISDSLEGVPARFGATRRLGKGYVYAFDSAKVISNKGMRDYRNAVKMVDVISQHSGPNDLILFDEYHHGLGRSQKLAVLAHLPRQVKIGALVIAAAILVLCYGRGRRFGAVRNLPSWENRRPGFEFVESVARLYQRAGAADLAAEILVKSLRQELCVKFGLSPDTPRAAIVRQIESDGRAETAARIDRLLSIEQAGQKLGKPELVHVAREIHSIESEMGIRPS